MQENFYLPFTKLTKATGHIYPRIIPSLFRHQQVGRNYALLQSTELLFRSRNCCFGRIRRRCHGPTIILLLQSKACMSMTQNLATRQSAGTRAKYGDPPLIPEEGRKRVRLIRREHASNQIRMEPEGNLG
jgi:hypothetical protein